MSSAGAPVTPGASAAPGTGLGAGQAPSSRAAPMASGMSMSVSPLAEGASGAAAGVVLASGWVSSSAGAPVATGTGASGTGLGAGAGAALGAAAAELREKCSNVLVPRTAFVPPPFSLQLDDPSLRGHAHVLGGLDVPDAPPVGGMVIRRAPFAVGARVDALGITRGRVPSHVHRQRRL